MVVIEWTPPIDGDWTTTWRIERKPIVVEINKSRKLYVGSGFPSGAETEKVEAHKIIVSTRDNFGREDDAFWILETYYDIPGHATGNVYCGSAIIGINLHLKGVCWKYKAPC